LSIVQMVVNGGWMGQEFSKKKNLAVVALWAALACTAGAQEAGVVDVNALPDAPSVHMAVPAATGLQGPQVEQLAGTTRPVAKKTDKFIPAGFQAQPLTARDKVNVTLRDIFSWESGVGFTLAAGYSQVTNGHPDYGSDKGAFGERLGAAAARDTSQDLFSGAIFAPILHEDPRYYVEGDSYGVVHRTLYAVTRPLITRSDSGHSRINGSLLLGYAAAAALTNAYYPGNERTVKDTARTYGASIGGAALGFFFQEFVDDALEAVHLHKRQLQ
jgi:hypothetical protein